MKKSLLLLPAAILGFAVECFGQVEPIYYYTAPATAYIPQYVQQPVQTYVAQTNTNANFVGPLPFKAARAAPGTVIANPTRPAPMTLNYGMPQAKGTSVYGDNIEEVRQSAPLDSNPNNEVSGSWKWNY